MKPIGLVFTLLYKNENFFIFIKQRYRIVRCVEDGCVSSVFQVGESGHSKFWLSFNSDRTSTTFPLLAVISRHDPLEHVRHNSTVSNVCMSSHVYWKADNLLLSKKINSNNKKRIDQNEKETFILFHFHQFSFSSTFHYPEFGSRKTSILFSLILKIFHGCQSYSKGTNLFDMWVAMKC